MRSQWKKSSIPAAFFIVCLVAFGAGTQLAHAEDNAKGPQAVFPDTRYEFGTIMEGQQVRHDFIVENRGAAPLVIERVQPD